jgi:hypothetical protein
MLFILALSFDQKKFPNVETVSLDFTVLCLTKKKRKKKVNGSVLNKGLHIFFL